LGENGSTAVHRWDSSALKSLRVFSTAKNFKSFKSFFAPYALIELNLSGSLQMLNRTALIWDLGFEMGFVPFQNLYKERPSRLRP